MDNIQKGLIFLFAAIGIYIFYSIVMYKLDVMATEAKAKIESVSADIEWESYQNLKSFHGQENNAVEAGTQDTVLP